MKGIVVEINKKSSVIMTEDGLFQAIKNKNYEVGQTISVTEKRRPVSKLAAMAASAAAVLVISTSAGFAYYTPTDYVSMDVNPSVEYSVNMFDRILDVKAVNDGGEKILSELHLNNQKLEDALKETLDKLMEDGYLRDDPDSGVVITTSNKKINDAEEMAKHLRKDLQEYLNQQENITARVKAEAVGMKRVEEARKLGVTPGKLNLVEKLQSSTGGAIDVEKWLSMPVKDINKAIKENKKQRQEIEKENKKQYQEIEKEQKSAGQKADQEVSVSKDREKETEEKASIKQNPKQNDDTDKWEDKNNNCKKSPDNGENPQNGTGNSDDEDENWDHQNDPPGQDKENHGNGNYSKNGHSDDQSKEDRSYGHSNRNSDGSDD